MARRAGALPETMAGMAKGVISEDQAAVIARRAPDGTDSEFADLAGNASVSQLQTALRLTQRAKHPAPVPSSDDDRPAPPAEPEVDRAVSTWSDAFLRLCERGLDVAAAERPMATGRRSSCTSTSSHSTASCTWARRSPRPSVATWPATRRSRRGSSATVSPSARLGQPARPRAGCVGPSSGGTAAAGSRGAGPRLDSTPTTSSTGRTADQRSSGTSCSCVRSTTGCTTGAASPSAGPPTDCRCSTGGIGPCRAAPSHDHPPGRSPPPPATSTCRVSEPSGSGTTHQSYVHRTERTMPIPRGRYRESTASSTGPRVAPITAPTSAGTTPAGRISG